MTRVVWITDPHLNFPPAAQVESFLKGVAAARPDRLLISGDFSESQDVLRYLAAFDDAVDCPVYFVLGNHDFYFSSIAKVRREAAELCRERQSLHYLSAGDVWELASGVGLVGHDGWADAREGSYERSYVMMNDYRLIAELAGVSKRRRWPLLKALGDEAAGHVRRVLPAALARYDHVFLVTHVPPLRAACWHEGRISDDEWAPHFTCRAMGDAILELMADHPQQRLTVLCGHTHGEGETRPLTNVHVITGGAQYGRPAVTRVFEL